MERSFKMKLFDAFRKKQETLAPVTVTDTQILK